MKKDVPRVRPLGVPQERAVRQQEMRRCLNRAQNRRRMFEYKTRLKHLAKQRDT